MKMISCYFLYSPDDYLVTLFEAWRVFVSSMARVGIRLAVGHAAFSSSVQSLKCSSLGPELTHEIRGEHLGF